MSRINASLITASMMDTLPFGYIPKGIRISKDMSIGGSCPNVTIIKAMPKGQETVAPLINPSRKNKAIGSFINIKIFDNIHNSSYSYYSTNRISYQVQP